MEKASNIFDSHPLPLPHQQLVSRIAFANNPPNISNNTISKVRVKKGTTRLPPITRYDSPPQPLQSIKYFNDSLDNSDNNDSNDSESTNGFDPNHRIRQLERNLKFVKQDCQLILQALHRELENVKTQNRDLQFELITNGSLSQQLIESLSKEPVVIKYQIKGGLEPHISQRINRLESEVKRLRYGLGETLKINAILRNELQKLKSDRKETKNEVNNNWLSSPTIIEFDQTFQQIYRTDKQLNQLQNTTTLPRITSNSSK